MKFLYLNIFIFPKVVDIANLITLNCEVMNIKSQKKSGN